MRVQGAAVTALVGVVATTLTAMVTGLDPPIGWGAYGLVVGGVCGWIGTPWIARDRPRSFVAFAVLIHGLGVLLFPLLAPLLSLEAPMAGPTRLDRFPADVLPMYLLTPMGFLVAVPFAPATLATAAGAGSVIWIRSHGAVERDALGGSGLAPDSSDAWFGRVATIAFVVIVLVTIGGYVWLSSAVRNIGYCGSGCPLSSISRSGRRLAVLARACSSRQRATAP